jgi:hypothetical protein
VFTKQEAGTFRLKGRNLFKIDKELLIGQHKKDIAYTINNSFSEATIDRLAKQTRFQKRKGGKIIATIAGKHLFMII